MKKASILPHELIDQILSESVLLKQDLCNIALASRAFCTLARPYLFETVTIECAYCTDESDPAAARALTHDAQRRLRFFRDHAALAALVRVAHRVDGGETFKPGDPAYEVEEIGRIWDAVYAVLPKLEEVHDGFLAPPLSSSLPPCTSSLRHVGTPWLTSDAWRWLSQCRKLRSLHCSFTSEDSPSLPSPLPFSLEHIRLDDLYGNPTLFLGLLTSSRSTLRSLDLCGRLAILTDFSGLPALEKLTLSVCGGQGKADPAHEQSLVRASLPTLMKLRTLVVVQHVSWRRAGGVFDVIAHPDIVALLPKSLERIECDDEPTLEDCQSLFGNGTSVRVLGVRGRADMVRDTTEAREWCEERGIVWRDARLP
ncbi:hypothetical protein JCM10908_003060 [Rhodotorula pacifica]|uniref:uncharacterized protein n=1 Tax=Rhodotorula pacifica TaxID=1495444 RepID=UPI003181E37E